MIKTTKPEKAKTFRKKSRRQIASAKPDQYLLAKSVRNKTKSTTVNITAERDDDFIKRQNTSNVW